jgi:hypothetical protein
MSYNLKDLKMGTILSGTLSGPQANTLTHLPFIVFDGVEKAEIDYSLPATLADMPTSYVDAYVVFSGDVPNKNLVEIFKKSVKATLFDGIRVRVINKKSGDVLEGSDE